MPYSRTRSKSTPRGYVRCLFVFVLMLIFSTSITAINVTIASAHEMPPRCLTEILYDSDPNCRAHWQGADMRWHWDGHITVGHHEGHRQRFLSAKNRYVNSCCPDSPWHTHFDTSAPTHIEMRNAAVDSDVLGRGLVAREDSNDHIPSVRQLWLRHDIWELGTQWYTGTGIPGGNQIDAWSVWQEELGHAQNVSHYGGSCSITMSGCTSRGDRAKRTFGDHLRNHLCTAYRRVHGSC